MRLPFLARLIPGYRAALSRISELEHQLVLVEGTKEAMTGRLNDQKNLVDALSVQVLRRKIYGENPTPAGVTMSQATAPLTSRDRAEQGKANARKILSDLAKESTEMNQENA